MAATNPQKINGNWKAGVALDQHTLSSTYLGVNELGHEVYDTRRSELGELLYRLKYRSDMAAAAEIIQTAAGYLNKSKAKFDMIIPVPPSAARAVQPVIVMARGIGEAIGVPVVECVTTTRPTEQLKGVVDTVRRKELLAGLHAVRPNDTEGKDVLLFDDLFRSGSTLNAITDLLLGEGKATSVRVLTITRTRSRQ